MELSIPTDDLILLIAFAFTAAMVRGFAGFGAALIYLPGAGQILPPFEAITTFIIIDFIGPLFLSRKAFRECAPGDLVRLLSGLVIALPIGLFTLGLMAAEIFRYGVSIIALILLCFLISGFRYRGKVTPALLFGTGGLSGFLQGIAGLAGPPVIFFYMASPLPARVMRANILLYLMFANVAAFPILAAFGRLETSAIILGLILVIPTIVGGQIGARLFNPAYERTYRAVAYAIIAISAINGLPLLD